MCCRDLWRCRVVCGSRCARWMWWASCCSAPVPSPYWSRRRAAAGCWPRSRLRGWPSSSRSRSGNGARTRATGRRCCTRRSRAAAATCSAPPWQR
ncbi:hypothetical protein ACFPRL_19930 [Pseudoclavibacter helvolus]